MAQEQAKREGPVAAMQDAERWEIRSVHGRLRIKDLSREDALELYRAHFGIDAEEFASMMRDRVVSVRDLKGGGGGATGTGQDSPPVRGGRKSSKTPDDAN